MSSRRQAAKDKVLSWGDFVLTRADCDLLKGPHWLNDQIISFFLQHLTHNRNSDDVLCLDCSLSFLASQVGPDAAAVVAPLAPSRFRFVLAAVNDNLDPEVAFGGSHWTLLMAHRPDAGPKTPFQFVHCDSGGGGAGSANHRAAVAVANVIALASGHDARAVRVAPLAYMPRQNNGYDCGLFVLATAELVCDHAKGGGVGVPTSEQFADRVSSSGASALRKTISELIDKLAQEQHRSNPS